VNSEAISYPYFSSERYEYYCWYSVSASSSWFELFKRLFSRSSQYI